MELLAFLAPYAGGGALGALIIGAIALFKFARVAKEFVGFCNEIEVKNSVLRKHMDNKYPNLAKSVDFAARWLKQRFPGLTE